MEIIALIIIIYVVLKLQGLIYKRYVFYNINYECQFSKSECFEGDELLLIESIENNKFLPVLWLKVSIHSSEWLSFAASRSIISNESRHAMSSFFLRGYQKTTREWRLKCLKRGVFTIENVTFISGDLFGLKSISIPVPVNTTLKVYPSIINLEDRFIAASFQQGDTIVKRWIIDDPFIISGAREYNPGDSMNRIHWHATARTGNLMVKKYDFTSQHSLTIVFNVQSVENEYQETVDKDIIEFGIKVVATILDKGLSSGIPVRMCINGTGVNWGSDTVFTKESAGKEHVCGLMEILAELKLKANKSFELFMDEISSDVKNSEVIIITPYTSEGIIEKAREMQNNTNRITLLLLDTDGIENIPEDIYSYYIPK